MKPWSAVFIGITVVGSMAIGCSSSSDDPAATPKLSGTYQATSPGAITEITFYDSAHYFLWRSPCSQQEKCLESGSYEINAAGTELALTDVDTGQTNVLPFEAKNVQNGGNSTRLRAQDMVVPLGDPLVGGGGGSLIGGGSGGSLVGDGGSIAGNGGNLMELIQALIQAFTAAGQSFSKGDKGDGNGGGSGGGADAGQGGGESNQGNTSKRVDLKYEGTCQFLRNCSTYSKNMPEGEVSWGCPGPKACSDSDPWVAAPSRSYCGTSSSVKTATMCAANGKCVSVNIRDTSVSGDWEAGNAVMSALGLPKGITKSEPPNCAGYGGGRVTVTY
ncbi:hypothetical protein [Pendulispora albinea]|uniref:Lipoprotein n=1 Tax=Pendulispora albinea TaxID=2741071 RepID=A0ABZ2M8G0_9BACT